jgi:hypothetical protein
MTVLTWSHLSLQTYGKRGDLVLKGTSQQHMAFDSESQTVHTAGHSVMGGSWKMADGWMDGWRADLDSIGE